MTSSEKHFARAKRTMERTDKKWEEKGTDKMQLLHELHEERRLGMEAKEFERRMILLLGDSFQGLPHDPYLGRFK